MELWIPITVAAAFSQNLRSALQKHLKGALSTAGATYVRFLYAAPLAVVYAAVLAGLDFVVPNVNSTFVLAAAIGAPREGPRSW